MQSPRGHWRDEQIFALTWGLELYRVHQGKIAECDLEIEARLERFADCREGRPPCGETQPDEEVEEHAEFRCRESPLPDDRREPDRDQRRGCPHGAEGD